MIKKKTMEVINRETIFGRKLSIHNNNNNNNFDKSQKEYRIL